MKLTRPNWTRSKTQIFAVLLVLLGAIQMHIEIFTELLTEKQLGLLGSLIGIVVYILRGLTTQSVSEKCAGGSKSVDSPEGEGNE